MSLTLNTSYICGGFYTASVMQNRFAHNILDKGVILVGEFYNGMNDVVFFLN